MWMRSRKKIGSKRLFSYCGLSNFAVAIINNFGFNKILSRMSSKQQRLSFLSRGEIIVDEFIEQVETELWAQVAEKNLERMIPKNANLHVANLHFQSTHQVYPPQEKVFSQCLGQEQQCWNRPPEHWRTNTLELQSNHVKTQGSSVAEFNVNRAHKPIIFASELAEKNVQNLSKVKALNLLPVPLIAVNNFISISTAKNLLFEDSLRRNKSQHQRYSQLQEQQSRKLEQSRKAGGKKILAKFKQLRVYSFDYDGEFVGVTRKERGSRLVSISSCISQKTKIGKQSWLTSQTKKATIVSPRKQKAMQEPDKVLKECPAKDLNLQPAKISQKSELVEKISRMTLSQFKRHLQTQNRFRKFASSKKEDQTRFSCQARIQHEAPQPKELRRSTDFRTTKASGDFLSTIATFSRKPTAKSLSHIKVANKQAFKDLVEPEQQTY